MKMQDYGMWTICWYLDEESNLRESSYPGCRIDLTYQFLFYRIINDIDMAIHKNKPESSWIKTSLLKGIDKLGWFVDYKIEEIRFAQGGDDNCVPLKLIVCVMMPIGVVVLPMILVADGIDFLKKKKRSFVNLLEKKLTRRGAVR